MPIYEYECEDSHRRELTRLIDERDRRLMCIADIGDEVCRLPMRRRVVPSSPAVAIFKGGGFTRSSNLGRAR